MFISIGLETYQSKIYSIGNFQANEREIAVIIQTFVLFILRSVKSFKCNRIILNPGF